MRPTRERLKKIGRLRRRFSASSQEAGSSDVRRAKSRSVTEEQVREERRLCFVGVCRAEDTLTITRIREYRGYPTSQHRRS
jgi:superfamily I DNA/RNA helicase